MFRYRYQYQVHFMNLKHDYWSCILTGSNMFFSADAFWIAGKQFKQSGVYCLFNTAKHEKAFIKPADRGKSPLLCSHTVRKYTSCIAPTSERTAHCFPLPVFNHARA